MFKYALFLVACILQACSSRDDAHADRGEQLPTSNVVCDISILARDGYSPRTVLVDTLADLVIPEDFGPYALAVEWRESALDDWQHLGIVTDVRDGLTWEFFEPGEYRFQARSATHTTGRGELYVLFSESDYGIELITQAPGSADLEPLDNTFAAGYDIDVELPGGEFHEGAYWELWTLGPAGPGRVVAAGVLTPTATSFVVPRSMLSEGCYLLDTRLTQGQASFSHHRSFEVLGGR